MSVSTQLREMPRIEHFILKTLPKNMAATVIDRIVINTTLIMSNHAGQGIKVVTLVWTCVSGKLPLW